MPSEAREPTPNFPTVKAIAPNAPIGAAHITMPTTAKIIFAAISMMSTSGFARSPNCTKPKPQTTAMKSTWRILPSAKAPTKVPGMMFVTNGTRPTAAVGLT